MKPVNQKPRAQASDEVWKELSCKKGKQYVTNRSCFFGAESRAMLFFCGGVFARFGSGRWEEAVGLNVMAPGPEVVVCWGALFLPVGFSFFLSLGCS